MVDFNTIPGIRVRQIVGNVTRVEPSRFNDNVIELTVAVNHGYKDTATDEWKDTSTTFVTYTAVGSYGADLKQYGPGDKVRIEAQDDREDFPLETRTYEKKDGGTGIQVTARYGKVILVSKKGEGAGAAAPSAPAAAGWDTPATAGVTPTW